LLLQGWQALQMKLSTTDAARAAASRTLAEQAGALEASERRRERLEADLARAATAGAAAAKAEKAAKARAADAEARASAAVRELEERLKQRDAALAAAQAERTDLIAALREADHAAKHAEKAAVAAKAEAKAEPRRREEKEKVHAALVPPATVESKLATAAAVQRQPEALRAIPEAADGGVAASRPPPSASQGGRERERAWPAPPPHPVWCASPATMPLSRQGGDAKAMPPPPAAPLAPAAPPARTPPRAESLTALAAEAAAAAAASSEEDGSFTTASNAASGSAVESAGSTQLSGGAGGAHPLPPLCRTPGSARKRLQMENAAMPSAGPARAEASSATRPGRAAERAGRERADRREASEREPAPRAALKPAREMRPAAPAAVTSKPAAAAASKQASRVPAVSFKNPVVGDGADALPPAPREPLGRRSVNEVRFRYGYRGALALVLTIAISILQPAIDVPGPMGAVAGRSHALGAAPRSHRRAAAAGGLEHPGRGGERRVLIKKQRTSGAQASCACVHHLAPL
jgi:hypothetical protein